MASSRGELGLIAYGGYFRAKPELGPKAELGPRAERDIYSSTDLRKKKKESLPVFVLFFGGGWRRYFFKEFK